jgi:hypothetical protein
MEIMLQGLDQGLALGQELDLTPLHQVVAAGQQSQVMIVMKHLEEELELEVAALQERILLQEQQGLAQLQLQ